MSTEMTRVLYSAGEMSSATSSLAKDLVAWHHPIHVKVLNIASGITIRVHDNGEIVGIDIDVLRAICDVLHMKCEIVDMEFDAVITSVQTGKADAGIAGITVTPERKKNITFDGFIYRCTSSSFAEWWKHCSCQTIS